MGTFEQHQEHLTVPWVDPALLPKTFTTHDAVTERVTVEDCTSVGDRQVLGGRTFQYDGTRWIETQE